MLEPRRPTDSTTPAPGRRIAGVPLQITFPAVLLFGFVVVLLATGLLPAAASGFAASAYWAAAVVGAGGVFASLVVRDLAQILTSRRAGLDTAARTLSPFGARTLGPPAPTPRLEARVAIAGPLANLTAAAVLAGLAALGHLFGVTPLLVAVASYLAGLNALLVAVHLLPGLPLDGGRLLRAWRWSRTGDRSGATYLTARVGRVVGLVAVAAGAAQLVLGRLSGLWIVLIGVFVISAARQEARVTKVHDALAGLSAGDALAAAGRLPQPRETVGLASWTTIDGLLADHPQLTGLDTVLALRGFDGTPAGLVPLAAVVAVPAERRADVRLRDLAVPADALPVARLDEQLTDIIGRSPSPTAAPATAGLLALLGHVIVVRPDDARQLAGVLTPADLARATTVAGLHGPSQDDAAAPDRPHVSV